MLYSYEISVYVQSSEGHTGFWLGDLLSLLMAPFTVSHIPCTRFSNTICFIFFFVAGPACRFFIPTMN